MRRILVVCLLMLLAGCSRMSEPDTFDTFPLVLDHEHSYAAYVRGEVQPVGEVRLVAVQYVLVNKGSSPYREPITMLLKIHDPRLQAWVDEEEIHIGDLTGNLSDEHTSFPVNDPRGFAANLSVTSDNMDLELLRRIIEQDQGLTLQVSDPDSGEILYEEAITRFMFVDETEAG